MNRKDHILLTSMNLLASLKVARVTRVARLKTARGFELNTSMKVECKLLEAEIKALDKEIEGTEKQLKREVGI